MVEGFEVGGVPFNPDGWGPPDSATTPTTTSNLPLNVHFTPSSRAEKLGRIAYWTCTFNNLAWSNNPSDLVFDFSNDESFLASADDDVLFRLVDRKVSPRPRFGPKWQFQQRQQLPHCCDEEVEAKKTRGREGAARRDRQYNMNRSNVNVPRQPEDLLLCGGLEFYDRSCYQIMPKNEQRLWRFKNRNFFKVTTTDDPIIRRLANKDKATVFATDTILSTLMCAPRSIYPWDIVVQRFWKIWNGEAERAWVLSGNSEGKFFSSIWALGRVHIGGVGVNHKDALHLEMLTQTSHQHKPRAP
ncbi:unnamed protein product [Prunus armeniaca]|uniref:Uncharacterized protein n=1 Tax=Prunus armeniaca TaxID=36596 RepID=A0A6J5W1Y5_PRUAR|nr:unnamed protein product [Prunus armeniaca]